MGMLKKTVKKAITLMLGRKVPRKKILDRPEQYVSFDIFDTLVLRKVSEPKKLFLLMEQKYALPGFCENRVLAEHKARETIRGDVTIEEIYRFYPGITSEDILEYSKRELEAELEVCMPNLNMMEFYRECLKRKKVVLLSDMYFQGDKIVEILRKCRIDGYEHLYVSCDEKATKRSGKLFRLVLDDLKISCDNLMHIGNELMADYVCAKRCGIHAVLIKPEQSG